MVSDNSHAKHSEDRSSSTGSVRDDKSVHGAHVRVPSDADEADDLAEGQPNGQVGNFEGGVAPNPEEPQEPDFPDGGEEDQTAFLGVVAGADDSGAPDALEGSAAEGVAEAGEEVVASFGEDDVPSVEDNSYIEGASYVNLDSASFDGETAYYSSVDSTDPQPAVVGQYSRENPHYSKASAKSGRGKKIALGVFVALFLVLVGCGSALAYWVNSVNEELTESDLSDEELSALADLLSSDTDFSEPFYVMLIGSDARSDNASMGARSDTNIVARVDLEEGIITLISIPRDTQIELEDYGTVKFNAAYAYGGAALVIEQANELLGIEISHYAEIDFEGLVDLVDAVGGVTVYVESEIDDSKAGDVVIEEGYQTLDGEAALVYARTRQYVDGDFTRTSHQRQLVAAIVEKVLSLSVTELPSVVQAAAECVTTDLSFSEILQLVMACQELDELTIYSCMVPSTTGTEDGISYVYTDFETLEEMMEAVEAGEDPSGYEGSYSSSSSDDDDDDEDEDESSSTSSSSTSSSSSGTSSSSSSSGTSTGTSTSTSTSTDTSTGTSSSSSGTDASSSSSSTSTSSGSTTDSSTSSGASSGSSTSTSTDTSTGTSGTTSSDSSSSSSTSGSTSSDSSSSSSSSDSSSSSSDSSSSSSDSSSSSSDSSSSSSGSTSSDTSSSDSSSSSSSSSSDTSSSDSSSSSSSSSSSTDSSSSSDSNSSSSSSSSDSSGSSDASTSDTTSTASSSSDSTDASSAA